jgi:hypothetical protein
MLNVLAPLAIYLCIMSLIQSYNQIFNKKIVQKYIGTNYGFQIFPKCFGKF